MRQEHSTDNAIWVQVGPEAAVEVVELALRELERGGWAKRRGALGLQTTLCVDQICRVYAVEFARSVGGRSRGLLTLRVLGAPGGRSASSGTGSSAAFQAVGRQCRERSSVRAPSAVECEFASWRRTRGELSWERNPLNCRAG